MDSLTVEYTVTQDDVEIALARYKRAGATPIILMHGFAQNYRIWDFPILEHNFAWVLYRQGYDVWLPSVRGHGAGIAYSGQGHSYSNIDDLAIYDVPAIIKYVTEATKILPIWIGHSLGGMLAYMYLQGVCYISINNVKVATGDIELAKERQKHLRGLVTIGTPVRLAWELLPEHSNQKLGFWQSNKILPWLMNIKSLRNLSKNLPYIPTANIWGILDSGVNAEASIGTHKNSWLKKVTHWSVTKIANSYLASLFWYPPNMNKELVENVMHTTLNNISSGVFDQFADWIENRTFRAYLVGQKSPYIYTEHFDRIKVPLLMITGNRDKLAPESIVYVEGFLKMGSTDKSFHCFEGFGHNDMNVGLNAPKIVYPFIETWLRKYSHIQS